MPDDATTTAGPSTTTDETPSRWDTGIWDDAAPGKLKPKWQESLPENFEPYKSFLQTFDSLEGMVKSHKDFMTQARTKGGVKPLTPESTDEEKTAYRKAFGIPDEPYVFEKPKDLPEGLEWQEDKANAFGKWAQENNLTPTQAKEALNLHMKFMGDDVQAYQKAQQEAFQKSIEAEREQLRTEFGGRLDGTVLKAKQVALKYGIPVEAMDPNSKSFLGVTMLKMASDLAAALGETEIPNAATVVNSDPLRQAKSMREKGHADYDKLKRGDPATMDKYYGLLTKAKEMGLIPK